MSTESLIGQLEALKIHTCHVPDMRHNSAMDACIAVVRAATVKESMTVQSGEISVITKPTEDMCTAARGFIMGLDMGIRNWGDMRKHLERGGYPTIPYIVESAEEGAGGHITKWDVADCIYQLMMTAAPAVCANYAQTESPLAREATCPACNGNDKDAPCAYPRDRKLGCLRDARLKREQGEIPVVDKYVEANLDAIIRFEVCNNGNLGLGANVDSCVEAIIRHVMPMLASPLKREYVGREKALKLGVEIGEAGAPEREQDDISVLNEDRLINLCGILADLVEAGRPYLGSMAALLRPHLKMKEVVSGCSHSVDSANKCMICADPRLSTTKRESVYPPDDPTNGMIIAALETSLEVRKEYGVDNVQPDMPGKLPSYMCKRVWKAMLDAWRTGYTGIEAQIPDLQERQ